MWLSKTPSLERALAVIRRKLAARDPVRLANLDECRKVVLLLDDCVHELNAATSLPDDLDLPLRSCVVQSAFPALEYYRQGDPEGAAAWLVQAWGAHVQVYGQLGELTRPFGKLPPRALRMADEPGIILALFNAAVSDLLGSRSRDHRARQSCAA